MARRILGMRWRMVLIGLLVLVVAGGATTAVLVLRGYHELTQIDRSNPKVVTVRYLDAVFVAQDPVGAALYTCSQPSLGPVDELLAELDRREREFDVDVLVSWGSLDKADDTGRTLVTTDLTVTSFKDGAEISSSSQRWRFTLIEEDGWRVCGAERLSDPASTSAADPSS